MDDVFIQYNNEEWAGVFLLLFVLFVRVWMCWCVFVCVWAYACFFIHIGERRRRKWIHFSKQIAEITKRDGHFLFSGRFWGVQSLSSLFPQQLLSEVFTVCCLVNVTSMTLHPSQQIQQDMWINVTKGLQSSQWEGGYPAHPGKEQHLLCGEEGQGPARRGGKSTEAKWERG